MGFSEIPNVFGDFMVMNHPEVVALRKREKKNALQRKYNKNPKRIAYLKAYTQLPKYIQYRNTYKQLPKYKILQQNNYKKHKQSEEWRNNKREYSRIYYQNIAKIRRKNNPNIKSTVQLIQ